MNRVGKIKITVLALVVTVLVCAGFLWAQTVFNTAVGLTSAAESIGGDYGPLEKYNDCTVSRETVKAALDLGYRDTCIIVVGLDATDEKYAYIYGGSFWEDHLAQDGGFFISKEQFDAVLLKDNGRYAVTATLEVSETLGEVEDVAKDYRYHASLVISAYDGAVGVVFEAIK